MSKIKNTFLISMLAFIGCKSYKKAEPTDITYSDFTNNQKHWECAEGNISYIDEGEGEPILLLHGVPTSGWLYRKMIDPLVKKDIESLFRICWVMGVVIILTVMIFMIKRNKLDTFWV